MVAQKNFNGSSKLLKNLTKSSFPMGGIPKYDRNSELIFNGPKRTRIDNDLEKESPITCDEDEDEDDPPIPMPRARTSSSTDTTRSEHLIFEAGSPKALVEDCHGPPKSGGRLRYADRHLAPTPAAPNSAPALSTLASEEDNRKFRENGFVKIIKSDAIARLAEGDGMLKGRKRLSSGSASDNDVSSPATHGRLPLGSPFRRSSQEGNPATQRPFSLESLSRRGSQENSPAEGGRFSASGAPHRIEEIPAETGAVAWGFVEWFGAKATSPEESPCGSGESDNPQLRDDLARATAVALFKQNYTGLDAPGSHGLGWPG